MKDVVMCLMFAIMIAVGDMFKEIAAIAALGSTSKSSAWTTGSFQRLG